MLDAHQLNVFLTAATTLNFTAAARQLHMSQPSVSQHIQTLENHFDMPLFVRSGRHLHLTAAGEVLHTLAHDMVQLSHHIEETMESLKGEIFGHLMVGCSTTVGKYILPFLLAEFLRQNPKVDASCFVTPRTMAVQMLCDGDVHLALASAREFYKDVEFQRLLIDPVILIVPLSHPWAARDMIEPEELLEAEFILRESGSGTRAVVEQELKNLGLTIDELHTVLTLGNTEAIALAVQEGIGVGFVSQIVVARLVQGRVASVKVRDLAMRQEIFIGRYTVRPATRAQSAFWEFLADPQNKVLNDLNASNITGDWSDFETSSANTSMSAKASLSVAQLDKA